MHAKRLSLMVPLIVVAALSALSFSPLVAAEPSRPNIVFILADDLGWRDLGCYGSTFHQTPNIDALAGRGVRFAQAYAANPLCSPTRASILTGLYPARIGITTPVCHLKEEVLAKGLQPQAPSTVKALPAVSITRLKQEYFTLAEALKEAGYRTGHFGKWHLGPAPFDPLHQGFDVDFPHWPGPGPAGSYVAPWKFPEELLKGKPGEHLEDRVCEEAVKFIRENKDRPFFLNYWCFSVHGPWDGKRELIEKYRATADPKNPQHNPVYGAMVQSLDEAVGRVVKTIDELGLAERTILVFFSDNGGVNWLDDRMRNHSHLDAPPTSNLPLRGGKATMHEGGTREPCIVVWPGVTRPGSTSDAILQSIDFFPTLLEMAGLEPKPGLKLDGVSFTSALRRGPSSRDTVFCHFPHVGVDRLGPATYVRQGDWKLIRRFCDGENQADRYELYNLREDLGESNDLAARMPGKVKELAALVDGFLQKTGAVVPKPNPAFNPPDRWAAGKDAKLELAGAKATVASATNRPTLHLLQTPEGTGTFVVKFRMRAERGRGALVLWGTDKQPGFASTRRVPFEPKFDGQWHEYEVRFTTPDTLRQLRIDSSLAPTSIQYEWIQLGREDGSVLQAWKF
jgi:arylsulfatase A-like enzyme